ncbi:MAG: hypothetical protein AVDCRST_MAG39-2162, partial [uncultured Sphingomonadaceae bacterium]
AGPAYPARDPRSGRRLSSRGRAARLGWGDRISAARRDRRARARAARAAGGRSGGRAGAAGGAARARRFGRGADGGAGAAARVGRADARQPGPRGASLGDDGGEARRRPARLRGAGAGQAAAGGEL